MKISSNKFQKEIFCKKHPVTKQLGMALFWLRNRASQSLSKISDIIEYLFKKNPAFPPKYPT